jgi:hypothetical protein
MRRTCSLSDDIMNPKKNDISEEKMFLSMKEMLHNPLQTIKSKELLNCVYKDNIIKNYNNNQMFETEKEKRKKNIILEKPNKQEEINNKYNDNFYFFQKENESFSNIDRNNSLIKFKIEEKEKSNSEMIDYNTSPNTHHEDNSDKIVICENINNINIDSEPLKDNNYSIREKNAMNEIKKLAQKIKNEINTFQICENTNRLSIEQTRNNNFIDSNCNYIFNINSNINTNNYNNVKSRKLPFEFINYSISDTTNNTNNTNNKRKNNNNEDYIKNFNAKINCLQIELNNENKKTKNENASKDKKNNNYDYRNYINKSPGIKVSKPDSDIYTREMEFMRKKELKLEQIRKKEMEEEMSELQYRPRINNISKKMTKNKTPIYKRIKEIETEKNNKLEKIKENINKNKQDYIPNKNKQKFNEEDFKKWLISNENWNVKKIIKLNNIKKEAKMDEEMNDECNFVPKINKNSEKICKNNQELSRVPVSERLCYRKDDEEGCTHRKKNEEQLTFIPKINKYYPISDKYYEFMETDQFEIYNKNLQKNYSNV